jgi:uncharacterized protein involved in exopolysaccharide biosynthesis
MVTETPKKQPTEAAAPQDSGELFDLRYVKNLIGSFVRAIGRHRVLTVAVFVLVTALGLSTLALLPKTWHVEAKLLASRSQVIRALGNPRGPGLQTEDPTRAAEEIVYAHDNLVTLIKQTHLLERYEATRSPAIRVRDAVVSALEGPKTEDDKLDAMVGTLEKKLKVSTDPQTVALSVDWPDPQMAFQIVETAQENFLEQRHVTEMAAISDALSILEAHARTVQKTVESALQELQWVRESRRKGALGAANAMAGSELARQTVPEPKEPSEPADPLAAVHAANEQELQQLKFLIQSKRRALADLEEFRTRRVSELQAQLAEQRVQYALQHPIVMDTLQRIQALEADSPQMSQVKRDIDELLREFRAKGGKNPDSLVEPSSPRSGRSRAVQAAMPASVVQSVADLDEDPLVQFARDNLRVASAKYEELTMRIDAARIEQDTARAAFKYRYSVVKPAQVPKKPLKPNPLVLVLGSLVLALGAAALAGGLRERWGGQLVEPWQVTSETGLPVLSEVAPARPDDPIPLDKVAA